MVVSETTILSLRSTNAVGQGQFSIRSDILAQTIFGCILRVANIDVARDWTGVLLPPRPIAYVISACKRNSSQPSISSLGDARSKLSLAFNRGSYIPNSQLACGREV